MSYHKCHTNISYKNEPSVDTPLNATNLNHTDNCVDILDDRIVALDVNKLDVSAANSMVTNITMDSTTGIFTVSKKDGTSYTIDTKLEKIAVNFAYNATTEKLVITLDDGTTQEVDLSSLVKETEFTDSTEIAFSVTSHNVSASIKDNSITDSKLESGFLSNCTLAKDNAELAASSANADKLVAEGFALGTQNGSDVGSTSPYYHNNAKWYKDQAQAIASSTLGGLSDVTITSPSEGQSLVYDSETATWVNGDGNVKFALLPVSGLSAIGVSEGITLSWTNPSDVSVGGTKVAEFDHVEIRKSGVVIASSVSGSSYIDTNVTSGVEYTYTVYAVTTSGVYSESASVVGSIGFNVKAWAELAGLNYTSLSAITEIDMRTLMTKHASCDYLVEAVESDSSVMSEFIANAYAMKWIGLRDYICDKLMAISAVKSAMLASDNWEYILKDHVPVMTSDTTPYGVVSASSFYSGEYSPYMAFDNIFDDTIEDEWVTPYSTNTAWIQYEFKTPINVRKLAFRLAIRANSIDSNFEVSCSNDGVTFRKIGEFNSVAPSNSFRYLNLDSNNEYYCIYRVTINGINNNWGNGTIRVNNLQFYGRSLNVSESTQPSEKPYILVNGVYYTVDYSERTDRTYLYDHGVKFEDITGSWGTTISNPDTSKASVVCEFNDEFYAELHRTSSGSNFNAYMNTLSAIDLSSYNRLCAFISGGSTSSTNGSIALKADSAATSYTNLLNYGTGIVTTDISNVNDSYYIRAGLASMTMYGSDTFDSVLTVKEIWLE